MRRSHAVLALGFALLLVPQFAQSQGLPDIVWEGGSVPQDGVAFSPDGTFVASCGSYDVNLWRASDGLPLGDFSVYPHGVHSVDISAIDPYVAVGYIEVDYAPWGVAAVWDIDSFTEVYTTGGNHVAFSPDGSVMASGGGGVNRNLYLTDVPGGSQRSVSGTGYYLLDVAYSPDGQHVATCGTGNEIRIWDPETGDLIRTLTGHTDDVNAIDFSPDGSLIVSGAGGWDEPGESTIKVWRVSDGELLQTLPGHGDWVHTVVFAPGGDVVVSGGRTGVGVGSIQEMTFWDIETGEVIRSYDEYAFEIDFSPDGQYFAYGRASGLAVARSPVSTGVDDPGDMTVESLMQVPSPNPFVGETTIRFAVPADAGRTELAIYNIAGRVVRTLVDGNVGPGRRSVTWDGTDSRGAPVASGIYYCRLRSAGRDESVKLTLLK